MMKLENWPGRWRVYQMLYLAFAATIALCVQNFWFPLAGSKVADQSDVYLFQSNVWHNEVFKRLEEISRSSPYDDLALTRERTIDFTYLNKVTAFHAQVRQILRVLGYEGELLIAMTKETARLIEKAGAHVHATQYRNAVTHLKQLEKEAIRQQKMREELEAFSAELRGAYLQTTTSKDDKDAAISHHVQQLKTMMKLFTKPELLLRPQDKPLAFLNEFGVVQEAMFKDYAASVVFYNERVEAQEFLRNLILTGLALVTGCLLFNAELRAWQSRNRSL